MFMPSKLLPALTLLAALGITSTAAAQTATAGDSVSITPSTKYDRWAIIELFEGGGHRDLWALPITVEEADLGSLGGGGLTPIRQGGGFMSHTLHMRGADGREYVMRSVDKFPAQGLAPELRGTIVADIAQGVVASLHPTGALVAAPILEAAGILHATPTYYRMPDDPRLGEFREAFAGLLVLFEERPRDGRDGGPSFAGATEIHNTANFLDAMERTPRNRLDAREFLRARLIDLLLGDRDRSVNNWLWARFEDGEDHVWRPIPRDRDQVFVLFDGLAKVATRLMDPRFVKFGEDYPSIVGLTRNAWDVDRPLLTSLEDEEWDEVVAQLKGSLSDEVIEDAVRRLPGSHYAAAGEELTRILKVRRDNLHEAAAGLYAIVAAHADVHLTDHDESVLVERLPDGSVLVEATELSDDGSARTGEPYYSRTFRPGRTEDVRIYAHGGDDVFRLRGGGDDAVRIRIMGGGGIDGVEVLDGANVGRLDFYDDHDTDRVSPAGAISTRSFRPRTPLYWPGVGTGAGTPDFGRSTIPVGVVGYSGDKGLLVGGGFARTGYGFAVTPFRYRLGAQIGWATGPARPAALVDYELRDEARGLWLEAHGLSTPLSLLRYHGFGNETAGSAPDAFYDPEHVLHQLQGMLYYSRNRKISVGVGANLSFMNSDTTAQSESLLAEDRPYGSGGFAQVGILSEVRIDTRDNPRTPTSGVMMTLGGSFYPSVMDVTQGSYSDGHIEVSAYVSPAESSSPTLAVRAGGRKVFGTYPFSKGAVLGGIETVRGLPDHRYLGDAVAYGNAEIRTHLFHTSFFLPLRFGGLAFVDVGRVFLEGEDSDTWRAGYGGGLWVAPNVSEYAQLDDMRFIVSVGRSGGVHAFYFSTRYAF